MVQSYYTGLSVNGKNIEKSKVNIESTIESIMDTQWLISFDQQGGGIGTGQPQVKLSWYPRQLFL